ncbi:MAG: Gfo/Idh/MocA family oxidoreductase [Fimbriiglobus sp.]|jgi:predicted dehydrogenase|nr:Gfo/Idh/MocA family oxidoreductase [Fimbriiglobus sp.]
MPSRLSRRGFLRTGVAAGAILALPASVYRAAFAADIKPSESVRIGIIGTGLQGRANMGAIIKNVVAVCDVDTEHLNLGAGLVKKTGNTAKTFSDYRKLLDAKDIDAVLIATPDHWHALPTIDACKAGKDVYCEKPLSLTIAESQAMLKAARDNKRVVQTGTQQRSGKTFRQAVELVRNNFIGKVSRVEVGLPPPNWTTKAKMPVPDSDPPAGLDFDFWTGPAPAFKYNVNKVHYLFRFFWDYSGGQQTNFGAHHLDIAQWALDMDKSGPTTVEGTAKYHKDGWYETPDWTDITYTYANGVVLKCGQGYKGDVTFYGEKGTINATRSSITVTLGDEKQDAAKIGSGGKFQLPASKGSHHADWLSCIKSRELPVADVEIGHRSGVVCHLGNIAIRHGKKITWDPAKEQIVGDADAAKWLSKEYRKPWKLG